MSAWIVEKGHIDALVQAMVVHRVIPMYDADEVGQMLWRENHDSVNYRYREDTSTPEYRFEGVEAPLDDAKVWRLLDCYDYQTCEHPAWRAEPPVPARVLCDALDAVYQDRFGVERSHDLNRDDLPWGINSIVEAVAA